MRRRLTLPLLIAMAVLLTGCTAEPRFGVRLSDDGRPALRLALCDNEVLRSAALYRLTGEEDTPIDLDEIESQAVWHISSPTGVSIEEVLVGAAPDGFTTVQPFDGGFKDQATFLAVVEARNTHREAFTLQELRQSEYLVSNRYLSASSLRDKADSGGACGGSPGPDWIYQAGGIGVLIAVAAALGAIIQRTRRSQS